MPRPLERYKNKFGLRSRSTNQRSLRDSSNVDDATENALRIWQGLSDENKCDPALTPFRKLFEKEKVVNSGTDAVQRVDRVIISPPEDSTSNEPAPNYNMLAAETTPVEVNPEATTAEIKFPPPEPPGIMRSESDHQMYDEPEDSWISTISKKIKYYTGDWGKAWANSTMLPQCGLMEFNDCHLAMTTGADGFTCSPSHGAGDKYLSFLLHVLLVSIWVFSTAAFVFGREQKQTVQNTFLPPNATKDYFLHDITSPELSVMIQLNGPFLTQIEQQKLTKAEMDNSKHLKLWYERWFLREGAGLGTEISELDAVYQEMPPAESYWIVVLRKGVFDFSEGITRSNKIQIPVTNGLQLNSKQGQTTINSRDVKVGKTVYVMRMNSSENQKQTIPLTVSTVISPLDIAIGVTCTLLLLCFFYLLIISEKISYVLAAVLASTAALGVLSVAGDKVAWNNVALWLNLDVLILLFSVMLLVSIAAETGIFDYLAVYAFQISRGKVKGLLACLCGASAILAIFLDTITTVFLMTPITIRACEISDIDVVPVLMCIVVFSNIGSVSTAMGDPPNVIISNHPEVKAAGINFFSFIIHLVIIAVLVFLQTSVYLGIFYRDISKLTRQAPKEIQDIRSQLRLWQQTVVAATKNTGPSDQGAADFDASKERMLKDRLASNISLLNKQLESMNKRNKTGGLSPNTFRSTLSYSLDQFKITDGPLLSVCFIAFVFGLSMFVLYPIPFFGNMSQGWIALMSALLLLVLLHKENMEPILCRLQWSTLLFLAALFVFAEVVNKLGALYYIRQLLEYISLSINSETNRLAVAILLILWLSALTSSLINNIPSTTMFLPMVVDISSSLKLPLPPLIWALSLGVSLGGIGTIIGGSGNIVCSSVAEQQGHVFHFYTYFKFGFPIMFGNLLVASVYLLFCHCLIGWH